MIPAGLKVGETEFLRLYGRMMAVHQGNLTEIADLPYKILRFISLAIDDHQRKSLDILGKTEFLTQIIQFLECNASTYDSTPDLHEGVFRNEYVECEFRETCPHQGKLCKVIHLDNGRHLTFSELRITSLIRKGLFDKEIANTVNIAEQTLRVHKRNIQEKLGVERKTQIATKAIEIGIA